MYLYKNELVCNSLLFMIFIYYSQHAFGLDGKLGFLLLPIMLLISFIYTLKVLFSFNDNFNFLIAFFLLHNLIYFFWQVNFDNLSILKSVLLNFFLYFPFYYFSKVNVLTRRKMIAFFVCILPFITFELYESTKVLKLSTGKEDVIDNAVYSFIGLLPFIFLIKNKVFATLFLFLILFLILGSNKKAALIAWVYAFVVYSLKDIYISNLKDKVKKLFSFIFFIALLLPVAFELYISNEVMVKRVELMLDGYSSGRDLIAIQLFNVWYESESILTYAFGFGYNATSQFTNHVSHNDWIDMLVSFGLFGVILYAIIFFSLFYKLFRYTGNKEYKIILLVFIGIALLLSMSSRWYWVSFSYFNCLILPYLLANNKKS